MKKAITLLAFMALLWSCSYAPPKGAEQTEMDSTQVLMPGMEEAPEVKSSIFEHVADSIFKLHPGDIKNEIIREDIAKDLKKYALQFKGKHMPLIEELPFKLLEVAQENGYIAILHYTKDADEKNLGLEVQLVVKLPREEAAKLYEDKFYSVKGIMAGFPYASVMPYALDTYHSYDMPLLSLGAIKIDNAELTLKK